MLGSQKASMVTSSQRRRRARPTSMKQRVIVCACLGLGAQTIVPSAEAWVITARAPWPGRGQPAPTTSSASNTMSGAISYRNPHSKNVYNRHATRRMSALAGSGRGGKGVVHDWGATVATAVFRQQPAPSALSSRSSFVSVRPWANFNAYAPGAGGRRERIGLMMSTAEEDGGAEMEASNAALGALAVAALGVLYYGLHDTTGGGGGGLHDLGTGSGTGPYSASLQTVINAAKAGPGSAVTAAQAFLASSVTKIEQLGPYGVFYFGVLYVLAEVLIIPALPLTTAAGYLFGVAGGTAIVLASATIAAAISFQLGRTLLREQVERLLEDNPKFRALDKAIAREGFKIMFLLRLSPIFPFALSNYLYGVTSVDFLEFMGGTLLGFFPGTLAYVYTGTLGKALTGGGDMALPWYGYVAGGALVVFILKTVGDIATTAVEEMEAES